MKQNRPHSMFFKSRQYDDFISDFDFNPIKSQINILMYFKHIQWSKIQKITMTFKALVFGHANKFGENYLIKISQN